MSKPYREYTEQDIYELKKENEKLKNERTIDLRNQLDQLKAENEELDKECQDKFNTIMKLEDEIAHLRQEGKKSCAYCKDIVELKKQVVSMEVDYNATIDAPTIKEEEYLKCLDEIKDLCKIAKNSNTGFYTLCDVVMLKIKEVKNGN